MKQPLDQLTKTICDALNGVAKVRKNFETFFIEAMILFISVKGHINFMQMSRYGYSFESRFRQNFQKDFDWVGYNAEFTKHTDGHRKNQFLHASLFYMLPYNCVHSFLPIVHFLFAKLYGASPTTQKYFLTFV